MKVLAIDPGAEIAAWVAAAAGVYALGRQVYEAIKKYKKEKGEITQALDQSPEVRQQLELGNIGAAISHLNNIIDSLNRDLHRRDMREEELEHDLDEARARAEKAEEDCRVRESDFEKERAARLRAKADLEEARVNFARIMADWRRRYGIGDGDDD